MTWAFTRLRKKDRLSPNTSENVGEVKSPRFLFLSIIKGRAIGKKSNLLKQIEL